MSLKAIQSSVPPSHHSITRKITLVPMEEVAALYSPCEVFTSAFWVRVKCGIYKNDIGYMLSRDGNQVDGELDSGEVTEGPWTISTSDFSPPSLLLLPPSQVIFPGYLMMPSVPSQTTTSVLM